MTHFVVSGRDFKLSILFFTLRTCKLITIIISISNFYYSPYMIYIRA